MKAGLFGLAVLVLCGLSTANATTYDVNLTVDDGITTAGGVLTGSFSVDASGQITSAAFNVMDVSANAMPSQSFNSSTASTSLSVAGVNADYAYWILILTNSNGNELKLVFWNPSYGVPACDCIAGPQYRVGLPTWTDAPTLTLIDGFFYDVYGYAVNPGVMTQTPLPAALPLFATGWSGMLSWDVFGIFSSWRSHYANRRTFQSCFYSLKHSGTECLVHVEITGAAIRQARVYFVVVVVNHFAIGV